MKKLILPALLISLTVFTSCDDEKDKPNEIDDPIVEFINDDKSWNQKGLDLLNEKLNNSTTAKGADLTKFAWTVSLGGTKLPTNFTADEVLSGKINENKILDATKIYEIKGDVYVNEGATLTIPAGTVIFADQSNNANTEIKDDKGNPITSADVLIVNKGGKLIAEGTAEKPIIFTSKTEVSGSWGGIVILGKAPINLAKGNGNAEIADNVSEESLTYGGTNADDNSGSLKYIILAYPGTQINTEAEYNGFSFYAVGKGTTLDNLEVFEGKDDSFEWFGGTVNASNLIGHNYDDTFDWAEGFVGTLDNILANQPEGADHCIEADNLKSDNSATPVSNPTIKNATLKSYGNDDAIKLRRGTRAQFDNVVIDIKSNTKANFEIDDVETFYNITTGKTTFKDVKIDLDNPKFAGNSNL